MKTTTNILSSLTLQSPHGGFLFFRSVIRELTLLHSFSSIPSRDNETMFAVQGGAGGGREAMAMLAARLMGSTAQDTSNGNTSFTTHTPTTTKPTAAKATIPRSVPPADMAPTTSSSDGPQAKVQDPPAPAPTAPAPAAAVKMHAPTAPVSSGPSLFGTAEQLKVSQSRTPSK